ncbi:MAG TPA: FAD-binding oxidoreductase [Nitriliruptorales bacterium]|nr:FAD-binding oxidoreductase [Nitriliruptorales bacterium]
MGPGDLEELRRLLPAARVETDADVRAVHRHDFWPRLIMAVRRGDDLPLPAAVVSPADRDEVVAVLRWCHDRHVPVVPFGAGTGVCGGAAPHPHGITLDLKRMNAVVALDEVSGTVTVQPGIVGQALEDHLRHRGWTLGHFPSSNHCSTLGGLLAVRSAGQASSSYGKLEDMVVGLEAVLADGTLVNAKAVPSSAAGPDLKRLFLGGEGTTGVITEATLRIHPAPEATRYRGVLFPDVVTGMDAGRRLLRTGLRPTVFRLYDQADTALFATSHDLDVPPGCLVVVGVEGREDVAEFSDALFLQVLQTAGGEDLGPEPGERWRRHRHDVSYRFAEYVKPGGTFGDAVMLDTMEVAALWARLPEVYQRVRPALQDHADLVLAHVSHVYAEGASVYFTFGAAPRGDEAEALRRYDAAWDAGQRAALDAGATISHHHGVGLLRVPWLADELGTGGWSLLQRVKRAVDPAAILNPGKLGLATDGR